MAFEGVSIDIMHNVLIVKSGLTQKVLLQKNLNLRIIRIRCFCKRVRKKAWFDKDAKNLVINAATSAMNGI